MMITIMKTPGSEVESPVADGNRKEGEGTKMRDLHKDTQAMSTKKRHDTEHCANCEGEGEESEVTQEA